MLMQSVKAAMALGAGVAGFQTVKPIYEASMVKVEVVRDLNEGSQIQSAMIMARADNAPGTLSLRTLKAGGYLAKIPKGWDASSSTPVKVLKSVNVCGLLNNSIQTGLPKGDCPPCQQGVTDDVPACMVGSSPVLRPV